MSTPPEAENARRLEQWQHRTSYLITLAALAPIIVSLGDAGDLVIALVGVVSWLVFLADLLVRMRLVPRYLHTGWGRFDLAIVILTAPWFLIPAFANTRFLALLRIARLGRLIVVRRDHRALAAQLNRVGVFAVLMVLGCAFIVEKADGPKDGFDNYGDGLWWAIVTLTTVGYGDLVPTSSVGRLTGAVLMISGIAILGVLAGTLASFFRLQPTTPVGGEHAPPPPVAEDLAAQVAQLSAQVEELNRRLVALGERPPP